MLDEAAEIRDEQGSEVQKWDGCGRRAGKRWLENEIAAGR